MSDSKSTREAELEELRRQNLTQNNAQKLAESAAAVTTPTTSVLDWQAQQKALKDQERMNKTQTAEFLHQYRPTGADADDIVTKLTSYKQEDRKSKQEAEQFLHNYRGTPDFSGKSSSEKKSATGVPDGVSNSRPDDQRSGEESVATLAAGFNQNGTVPENLQVQPQQRPERNITEPVMVDATAGTSSKDAPRVVPPWTVPSPPAVTTRTVPPPTSAAMTEPMTHDEKPRASDDGDWVSVESSSLPSPEKIEDILTKESGEDARNGEGGAAAAANQQNAASFDSEEDASRAVTEAAGNLADDDALLDDDEDTVMTEAQVHASFSGGGHVSLRLDVEFSFGLITNDTVPNTDKYMRAVAFIAGSLFAESRPAGTGGHAIYNSDFQPFVRVVEDDNDFTGPTGNRFVVHASLPMFIINWGEATSTREGIKNVLKNSIQDGSFLRLALEASY